MDFYLSSNWVFISI